MLVTLQGFGNIWSGSHGIHAGDSTKVHGTAYYNTTGVLVNGRVRYRWRIGGKIRFNSTGGFDPNYPVAGVGSRLRVRAARTAWRRLEPDAIQDRACDPCGRTAYLFVVAPEKTGRIDISSPFWKPASVQVVAFSEDSDQQQAMRLCPHIPVHGELGHSSRSRQPASRGRRSSQWAGLLIGGADGIPKDRSF